MKSCLFILVALTALVSAQERKQISAVPLSGSRPVTLNANNIQREGAYPSVLRLSGQVRIVTPTCLAAGVNGKQVCEGYTILTADQATYDEASGVIQAHGDVTVTPLRRKE